LTQTFIVSLFTLYGPLAAGWVLSLALGILLVKMWREHLKDYRDMAKDMQHSLDNNTQVLTSINVRLEERTK